MQPTEARADDGDIRVVIAAENASSRFGGEAILPLHYFRLLRKRGIEAWLVVHDRCRAELEALFPEDRDRICFIEDLWVQRLLNQMGQYLPHALRARGSELLIGLFTQQVQQQRVRKLVARERITVVHQPTPVSPVAPSLLHDLGAPVVIGPMNGGMTYPEGFKDYQSRAERAFMKAGRLGDAVLNRLIPGKRRAAALLVANQRTKDALPRGVCRNVIDLVENGVVLSLFEPLGQQRVTRARPRFVFLGRLVAWKAVGMLLDAMAKARKTTDFELVVAGDGVVRRELEDQARRLGLERDVTFLGFVPQHDCPALLADSDGLVLPSLYECGGAVVLEAMAMGLPVIATRWGGPCDYVTPQTGILVDPVDRETFEAGLCRALVELATMPPEQRRAMGELGRRRVEQHFGWEQKIDTIIEIYRSVSTTRDRGPPR